MNKGRKVGRSFRELILFSRSDTNLPLAEAKEMREDSDYEDFVVVSNEEVEKQIKDAEVFIEEIEEVLKKKDEENQDRLDTATNCVF